MKKEIKIQSRVMKRAWILFKRMDRTMENWSVALTRAWAHEKLSIRLRSRMVAFDGMSYLKENRNWIIGKIMEYNSRAQLVDCMTAIKEAVMNCSDEDEAEEKVVDIAMLRNFDRGAFVERNQQILRERKRTVFN